MLKNVLRSGTMACLLTAIAAQLAPSHAIAQLTVPANHATTSVTAPNYHLLFTPAELTAARNQWQTPATYVHASFLTTFNSIKSSSQGRSNFALAQTLPADFNASGLQASVSQAKALRWLMEDADLNPSTGTATQIAYYTDVRNVLVNYMRLTGGSNITRPEVASGYLAAYDMINPYLDSWDVANSLAAGTSRAAIVARFGSSTNFSLGSTFAANLAGNQGVKYGSEQMKIGMLIGNESTLDTGVGRLRTSYNNASTNDGLWTDGQRYFTYGLVNLPNALLSYQRLQGGAADPTGSAQYVAAMEQTIRFNISTAQPNGNSTLMHNGEESPTPLILLGRIVSDTNLKSAALWHFQQSGGMGVGWSSWTNIANSQDDYPATDFFVGGDFTVASAQPNWSPTFHSGGQAHTAVFKNNWSTSSNFMLITGGLDGASTAGFVHHDTASISMAANGTPVIVEPGYNRIDLSNSSGVNALNTAVRHNVLLARNTGGTITPTAWGQGNSSGQTNTGNNMVTTNRLDSDERGTFKGVADFNSLKATYVSSGVGQNVQLRRSTGMINESATDKGYFIMADSVRATAGGNKDFAVNLIGKSSATNTQIVTNSPSYMHLRWSVDDFDGTTENGTGEVYKNGAILNGTPYNWTTYSGQVRAHIVASGDMSVSWDTAYAHENYDRYFVTQRMQVYITNKNQGAFLTLFELGTHNAASKWTVTPFSSLDAYAAASVVSTDGWTDWHISQTDAADTHATTVGAQVSIDSGALASNAQYAYLRRIGGDLDSAMISRGTNLFSNGSQLLGASSPLTGSFLFDTGTANNLKGTVSGDDLASNTSLAIYGIGPITSATLDGSPITFTNSTFGYKSVVLAGTAGGSLVINWGDAINSIATTATQPSRGVVTDYNNVLTLGTPQNHGHVELADVAAPTVSAPIRLMVDLSGTLGDINTLIASLSNGPHFTILTTGDGEFDSYALLNPGPSWDMMVRFTGIAPEMMAQLEDGPGFLADTVMTFDWAFEDTPDVLVANLVMALEVTQIPEPASLMLLTVGGLGLLTRRRRA